MDLYPRMVDSDRTASEVRIYSSMASYSVMLEAVTFFLFSFAAATALIASAAVSAVMDIYPYASSACLSLSRLQASQVLNIGSLWSYT